MGSCSRSFVVTGPNLVVTTKRLKAYADESPAGSASLRAEGGSRCGARLSLSNEFANDGKSPAGSKSQVAERGR